MNEINNRKKYIDQESENGEAFSECGRGKNRRGKAFGHGRRFRNRGARFPHHLKPGEEGHLSDLRRGQKCIVLNFHNDNKALRRRLLDMGITKGVEIEIKKTAPLGDPVDIYLRGYELCLRKADMHGIDIKVIK